MSDGTSDATAESTDGSFPIPVGETGLKLLFYGGLLIYVITHVVLARDWSWENKLFPYLVGFPMIVLIVVNLVLVKYPSIRERFTATEKPTNKITEALSSSVDESETVTERAARHKAELGIVLWTISLPIAVYLLGFAWSLPPYVFVFILFYLRDLKAAITGTVLFTAFSYVVFLVLLNLRVYHGVLGLPNILEYVPS
jgi:hypothetical protein